MTGADGPGRPSRAQAPLGELLRGATGCHEVARTTLGVLLREDDGRGGCVLVDGVPLGGSAPPDAPTQEHDLGHGWGLCTWVLDGTPVGSAADDAATLATGRTVVALHAELAAARADAGALVRRGQHLEHVLQIQRLLSTRADREAVLEALVAGAMQLLGSDSASVHERIPDDPEHLAMVAAVGVVLGLADDFARVHESKGLLGRVVREGVVVVTERYRDGAAPRPEVVRAGIGAVMGAPVRVEGRAAAALIVSTTDPHRRYTQEDQDVLATFVGQAEIAIRDARIVAERDAALRDALTGLPGRRLLRDRLDRALEVRARTGAEVGFLFIDLDGFKPVNDVHGHAAGDAALCAVAARLSRRVRPSDTLARFGGDEFAVLVEGVDAAQLGRVVDRVADAFTRPFEVGDLRLTLGASVGVARSHADLVGADDLVADADAAMYTAKAAGGGTSWSSAPR